jgi:hypothetical protein
MDDLIQLGKRHFIAHQDVYKVVIILDTTALLLLGPILAVQFHLGVMIGFGFVHWILNR